MTRRLVFLVPGALALLAGLDAALLLLGGWAPVTTAKLPDLHGILMVFGFLGTLIALERSVALARPVGFIAPALLGLGSIAILTPAPLLVGQIILLAGSLAFTLLYIPLFKRNLDDAVLVQALGAVMLTAAALMWLGGVPVSGLIAWLTGYVVLTIAAERLELARMSISGPAVVLFRLLVALFALALLISLLWPAIGMPALGAALLALVAWLLINDVARRTWRAPGQPGFIGACLMAGYMWLAVAGLIWVLGGVPTSTRAMDATIHSVFLGFAISMIMAHASVILPAVLRIRLPYHRSFYGPAALLHASLILRIGLGDGLDLAWAVEWGGVINVIALLGFAGLAAASAITATRKKAKATKGTGGSVQTNRGTTSAKEDSK
ncbi:hypothetical protein [Brevibacterium spongiae]|uniref:NnrS family protein n=1 Tax=Brevibacterium spongiae TaxID=2909672 RepID=A0ABY5SPN2_9MICO|nr:hypothetical protein [Brevibacterium spongiae]UVI35086.1 hypothetical protein L1F31_13300 [Brevibacterium spongiae]